MCSYLSAVSMNIFSEVPHPYLGPTAFDVITSEIKAFTLERNDIYSTIKNFSLCKVPVLPLGSAVVPSGYY